MTATNCNIVKQVYDKITSEIWGLSCVDKSIEIAKSYIQYLDCPTVQIDNCKDEDCAPEGGTGGFKNCVLEVRKISFSVTTVEEDTRYFFHVLPQDIIGTNPPYSLVWSFDEDVFELVEETEEGLTLKLKEGVISENLVTAISVVVIDDVGCTDAQTCWWIGGEDLECGAMFLPCPNNTNLIVVPGDFIPCPTNINLLVRPFVEEEDVCDDDSIISEIEQCIIAEDEAFIVTG